MTVVSTKEFVSNDDKYFDLTLNEQVFVKRERDNTMSIISRNQKEYLEPDEDFRRAITADEFRNKLIVAMDKIYKKYANTCK